MRKSLLVVLPLASSLMFSGCATLFGGGGKQTISIKSDKALSGTIGYLSDDNKTINK